MKGSEALRRIADITASQWGMVTARQAESVGVGRLDLSRLTAAGHLERLEQGVYRDSGAPSDNLEHLRAAWLSTEPDRLAAERLRDRENGIVVSGLSAATVHNVGDFREGAHEFTSPTRRQTKRPDIRYRNRKLPQGSVVIRDGLPVTSPEQTIADLLNTGEDLSLVSQVVRDAANDRLDGATVLDALSTRAARRYGIESSDHLWKWILRSARIDNDSIAEEVAASPIGPAVAEKYLRDLLELLSRSNVEGASALLPPDTRAALQRAIESASITALPQIYPAHADRVEPLIRKLVQSSTAHPRERTTSTTDDRSGSAH